MAVKERNIKPEYKPLIELFNLLTGKRHLSVVFSDCIELMTIAIQNSCEFSEKRFQKNEERYNAIAKGYSKDELSIVSKMLGEIANMLEEDSNRDLLGELYMQLGLGQSSLGQEFTPYSIAKLLVNTSMNVESIKQDIAKDGFIRVAEPSIGGGCTVIALCNEMKEAGINYQENALIVGQDLSRVAGLQAYVILSLLGAQAIIKIGDTLVDPYTSFYKELLAGSEIYYTPALIYQGNIIHKLH